MSETVARRQPIDLDEFERRLRGPATPARPPSDDPLAELARLVGGDQDPFSGQNNAARAPVRAPAARLPEPPQAAPSPRPETDWTAIETSLQQSFSGEQRGEVVAFRGTLDPSQPDAWSEVRAEPSLKAPRQTEPVLRNDFALEARESEPWLDDGAQAPAADFGYEEQKPRKSRKALYAMGGLAAAVVIGIGGTFALRGRTGTSGEPPVILAANAPSKIQVDNGAKTDAAQNATVLDKTNNDRLSASKVVSKQEEPVDLAQAARQAPRIVPTNGAAAPASQVAGLIPPPAGTVSPLPEPRKVKTVSVRPDGSIISSDTAPAVSQAAPAAVPAPALPAVAPRPANVTSAQTSAAVAAAPATPKATTPKTTTRIPTTPKTEVANLATGDAAQGATTAPKVRPTPRTPVADGATASGGAFAVQLAAATSEQEARDTIARLSGKFAAQLDGHKLAMHKGDSNGKTVFRIRASGYSKEEAADVCSKVSGNGGACFVARN